MKRIACLAVLALVVAGCAGRSQPPATTATVTPAHDGHATPATARTQDVELRHFYLLSPGPSSTLVVTRRDTANSNQPR